MRWLIILCILNVCTSSPRKHVYRLGVSTGSTLDAPTGRVKATLAPEIPEYEESSEEKKPLRQIFLGDLSNLVRNGYFTSRRAITNYANAVKRMLIDDDGNRRFVSRNDGKKKMRKLKTRYASKVTNNDDLIESVIVRDMTEGGGFLKEKDSGSSLGSMLWGLIYDEA